MIGELSISVPVSARPDTSPIAGEESERWKALHLRTRKLRCPSVHFPLGIGSVQGGAKAHCTALTATEAARRELSAAGRNARRAPKQKGWQDSRSGWSLISTPLRGAHASIQSMERINLLMPPTASTKNARPFTTERFPESMRTQNHGQKSPDRKPYWESNPGTETKAPSQDCRKARQQPAVRQQKSHDFTILAG